MELLGHRYYDPAAGRFLTRDPIGWSAGANLYAYASTSLLGRHDATGLGTPVSIQLILGCASALAGTASGGGDSDGSTGSAICNAIQSCIIGALCGLDAVRRRVGPRCGCIVWAICSVLQDLNQYICQGAVCGNSGVPNQCEVVSNTLAGCACVAASPAGSAPSQDLHSRRQV